MHNIIIVRNYCKEEPTIHNLSSGNSHCTGKVTLDEVLAAKENRRRRQQELLQKYCCPVISITINMPGPVKDLPIIRRLADYAADEMKIILNPYIVKQLYLPTGPEVLMAAAGDAQAIKAAAVGVEEEAKFGRLLDIDVFDSDGSLVSRRQQGKSRSCLVCGQDAVLCMRERVHTLAELDAAVKSLLIEFKAHLTSRLSPAAQKIGSLAVEAMLYEATCTPAPGLVDRHNSGAHTDMDFFTFMASSAALSPGLARTAQAGIDHEGSLPELLPVLRIIGREAEADMLSATKGVNTQKGLLFSLGIAAAAAGQLVRQGIPLKTSVVLDAVAEITAGIVERELGKSAPHEELTAGERLYHEYKITGIRGEMEAGLPAVREWGLPALRAALAAGQSINNALVGTLLVLMMNVDDTTVMHRHNPDKMRTWVRGKAAEAVAAGGMAAPEGRQLVAKLDEEFIAHNVSPGGAADLLAVTWFVHKLELEF